MSTCPSHHELIALLSEDQVQSGSETLVSHIGMCQQCQERLADLSVDRSDWREWESMLVADKISWPRAATTVAGSEPSLTVEDWPSVPGYELLEVIGSGGMGIVYKARYVALDRLVALKRMRTAWQDDIEFKLRFQREAETLAKLQHPNLVQIYDVLEHEGVPFLALEYVPGKSLDQYLSDSILLPLEAAQLIELLARAIHFAHDEGVVHRDLKPANILMGTGVSRSDDVPDTVMDRAASTRVANACPASSPSLMSVKITDFGLARHFEMDNNTKTGAIMGTPSYMAPEQARGDTGWGKPAADIYSLGAVLYECLTGRPPFRAESSYATVMQVVNDEPIAPSRIAPRVPRDLETICLKSLRKDPPERYESCADLAEDLRLFQAGKPIHARRRPWWIHVAAWTTHHPALTVLASLLAITCIASLVFWLRFTTDLRDLNNELTIKSVIADRKRREAEVSGKQARDAELVARNDLIKMGDRLREHAAWIADNRELKAPKLAAVRTTLLEQDINAYWNLINRLNNDPELTLRSADAYHKLGVLLRGTGDWDTAAQCLDKSVQLMHRVAREKGYDSERDSGLGIILIEYCSILHESQKFDESIRRAYQAINIFQQEHLQPALEPGTRYYRLAIAYHELSKVHLQTNADTQKVLETLSLAQDSIESSVGHITEGTPSKEQAERNSVGAIIHRTLGRSLNKAGELDQAESVFFDAIEFGKEAVLQAPGNPSYKSILATAYCYAATVRLNHKDYDQSLELYTEALELRTNLLHTSTLTSSHRYEEALIRFSIGNIHRSSANIELAREQYQESITIHRELLSNNPEKYMYASALGAAIVRLASLPREPGSASLQQFMSDAIQSLEQSRIAKSKTTPIISRLKEMLADVVAEKD